MTVAEFIEARLDDDETGARMMMQREADLLQPRAEFFGSRLGERVLRQVTAIRAILAEHAPGYPTTYPEPSGQPTCAKCHSGGWDWDPEDWPCVTVRALAAVWSDHPDYQQEWTP